MTSHETFECPKCGAALDEPGDRKDVKCPFCGSLVIVPPELRNPSPKPVQRSKDRPPAAPTPQKTNRLAALGVVFIIAMVLVLIIVVVVTQTIRGLGMLPASDRMVEVAGTPFPQVRPTEVMWFGGRGNAPGNFSTARAIAVDNLGNVFVADDTNRIQYFDDKGNYAGVWELEGKTNASDKKLLADRAGHLYVLTAGIIYKYGAKTGALESFYAGEKTDSNEQAAHMAFAPDSSLWAVADANGSDDLVHIDAGSRLVTRIPKVVSSQLKQAVNASTLQIAVDKNDNIFILALQVVPVTVFRYMPNGAFVKSFPVQFRDALNQGRGIVRGIAVDSQGRLYIPDDWTAGLQIFNGDGKLLNLVYYGMGTMDVFTLDEKDELFVVDYRGQIVHRYAVGFAH
jgi:DNA-directed RNA polymerase subunit RPC12/RpoP